MFSIRISGLECLPTVNLPAGCFCTSGPTPTPYVPIIDLLGELESRGKPVVGPKNETMPECFDDSEGILLFFVNLNLYEIWRTE